MTSSPRLILGYDIGGTKAEAALLLVQDQGTGYEIHSRQRIPTNRLRGYDAILKDLAELGQNLLQAGGFALSQLHGIGIGLPGSVDPQTGRMIRGNSSVFANQDLRGDLSKLFGGQVLITTENDANCFAYAEATAEASAETRSNLPSQLDSAREATVVGIILGTGVGSGIVCHNQPLRGHGGGAGEWGHTVLYSQGLSCYCGRRGCAEQYLSGPALEASFARRRYHGLGNEALSARDIFTLGEHGDPIALAVIEEYRQDLSAFLLQITNALDPQRIILGGGVSQQQAIYQGINEQLEQRVFARYAGSRQSHQSQASNRVIQNRLGDSSGVIGAALLCWQALQNRNRS